MLMGRFILYTSISHLCMNEMKESRNEGAGARLVGEVLVFQSCTFRLRCVEIYIPEL